MTLQMCLVIIIHKMVRKIGVKSRGIRVRFYSAKMKRIVWCESELEMSFCLSLEFDKEVESYREQPEKFELINYVPDFLVEYRGAKKVFYEVKPNKLLCNPHIAKRLEEAEKVITSKGYEFRIWTDKTLSNTKLANYKFLYRFHKKPNGYKDISLKVLNLIQNGTDTLNEIIKEFPKEEAPHVIPVVWHMVFAGMLIADLEKPLTNGSKLCLG